MRHIGGQVSGYQEPFAPGGRHGYQALRAVDRPFIHASALRPTILICRAENMLWA
jgi:hypothetical protein